MQNFLEWAFGALFTLIIGAFGYTHVSNRALHGRIDEKASKEDVQDLRDRINLLYEHALNRPIEPELMKKKNGLPH